MDSAYGFVQTDPDTGEALQDKAGNLISNTDVLPAPQANMMAAVSKGLLSDPAKQPWLLYGMGAIVAIILYMSGVPMLASALGMYLPIGINMAVLFGAFTAFIVGRTGGSDRVRKARAEQGTLIASGMMAGAAIFGIVTAIFRLPDLGALIRFISVGVDFELKENAAGNPMLRELEAAHWYEGGTGQAISLGMYILLAVGCFLLASWGAKGTIAEDDALTK